MGEEALERCVTCERVPLTLYPFSDGVIALVRFGRLCSSVILYSDNELSPVIPVGASVQFGVIPRAGSSSWEALRKARLGSLA